MYPYRHLETEDGRKYDIYVQEQYKPINGGDAYFIWAIPKTKGNKPKGRYQMKVIYTEKQKKLRATHLRVQDDINYFVSMLANREVHPTNKKNIETHKWVDGEIVWCN